MKHNRIIESLGAMGLAACAFMLIFTSPTAIGPFGVLLFFTTLYITIFCLSTLLYQVLIKIAFGRKTLRGKDYLYTSVFAFGPIMFLMARAFGALSIWVVSLIVVFLILAEFLVYKKA